MENCSLDLSSLSKRILHALKHSDVKKATLAHLIGVKPQVIQYLCQGDSQSSRFTFEIASALEVNPEWLATGEGAMLTRPTSKHEEFKRIPLITGNKPEDFPTSKVIEGYNDNSMPGVYTDNSNVSFAYKHLDPSMEPVIPAGSMIFFELSKEYKKENSIVLAYIKALRTTVIRKLERIDKKMYLYPFNDTLFKPIPLDENVQIIAKLAECHWKA